MYNWNVAYKAFAICTVLFCIYMQWSPAVDFDYIWIDSHERCASAADSHQMNDAVAPTPLQCLRTKFEDSVSFIELLAVEPSPARLDPTPTLRL